MTRVSLLSEVRHLGSVKVGWDQGSVMSTADAEL